MLVKERFGDWIWFILVVFSGVYLIYGGICMVFLPKGVCGVFLEWPFAIHLFLYPLWSLVGIIIIPKLLKDNGVIGDKLIFGVMMVYAIFLSLAMVIPDPKNGLIYSIWGLFVLKPTGRILFDFLVGLPVIALAMNFSPHNLAQERVRLAKKKAHEKSREVFSNSPHFKARWLRAN